LVILSTATIVSLYGILERLGIDKHLWVQDVQNRIFSTLGQPNWLAAYLLTLIPLTLAFASKNAKYYLLTAIYLLAIYFTRSRSGFLGVGTAVGLYFLFKRFSLKVVGVVAGLGLLALVIAQSQFNLLGSRVPFDDSAPAIYSGGSSSSQIREVVWRGALDIWKAYPVFGSGVETFAYSYYNFRPVEHNLLSEWDFLYNKAHNEFLNFLATSGAFGLISYSLIIFWFTSRAKKSPELVAGFLGLSVSNFFGFSVVPVGLFFFLFPALSLVGKDDSIEIKVKNKQYYFIGNKEAIAITIVFLIACWFSFRLISWWQADKLFNYGRNYLTANQVELGYNYLVEAVSRKPNEPLFRSDLGEAAAKLAVVYDQAPKSASNSAQLTAARDQLINQAVAESDLVLEQNKVHLNFYKSRAKIFLLLNTIEGQYLNQALETVIQAIELAPTDAKLHYNLGLLYQQLNQTELAKQALEETIELKPNYEAARFSLGSLYQQLDQPDLAREQYQYILQFLNPENQQVKDELQKL
jgi:Flp pilus assembly protein TadD